MKHWFYIVFFLNLYTYGQTNCGKALKWHTKSIGFVVKKEYNNALTNSRKAYLNATYCSATLKKAILQQMLVAHLYQNSKDSVVYYTQELLALSKEKETAQLRQITTLHEKIDKISLNNQVLVQEVAQLDKEKRFIILGGFLFIVLSSLPLLLLKKHYKTQVFWSPKRLFTNDLHYLKYGANKKKANTREIKIYHTLKTHLATEKAYLNPNLKVAHLAKQMGTNIKYLSYAVNSMYGNSVSHFINSYRIKEAKHLIETALENYRLYSLNHIWKGCGFNSNVHFYRTFKSITGITPAQYQKQLIDTQSNSSNKMYAS